MEDVGRWPVRKSRSRRGDGSSRRGWEGNDRRNGRQGSDGRAADTVLAGVEAGCAAVLVRAPGNAGSGRSGGLLVRAAATYDPGQGRAGDEVQAEEKSQEEAHVRHYYTKRLTRSI
jgi:hypothetical protein